MVPVILSGGFGTRLWPVSRKVYPKQFHQVVGEMTLLQSTVKRAIALNNAQEPLMICNEAHRFILAEQIKQLSIKPKEIILEPIGKNTAPAIALAAFKVIDEDPLLLICPSDHYIEDEKIFSEAVTKGIQLANRGKLITFGIQPTYPATCFGYIEPKKNNQFVEAYEIASFKEKPEEKLAEKFIALGSLWNSGIFLFKASIYLEHLKRLSPKTFEFTKRCIETSQKDLDFTRINGELFSQCPNESIDCAIMEKSDEGVVIPLNCGWSDLGSWKTIWEIKEKDANNNVTVGDVQLENTNNCYLRSEHKLIVANGVDELSIIETDDAILVTKMNQDQGIKTIVDKMSLENRSEVNNHRKCYRPWGNYDTLLVGDRHQVKKIIVNPGCKLSLQYHFHRAEHWVVVKGTAKVTKGKEIFVLTENQSTYIPRGEIHRLENPSTTPLEIIEVQSGSYLGEDDIVRLEDDFNRD